MKKNWKKVSLNEIVSKLGDGLHGTPKYSENGEYAFINGNNLSNGKIIIKNSTKKVDFLEYEKYKKELNNRTILVSINGTLGNVGTFNNEKVILGKSACYLNVNHDVNKDFIRFTLENNVFQEYIKNNATGTTIKNVSLKTMREFEIDLPPKSEQDKIVSIIKPITSKIETNEMINKNLEKQIHLIFKNWFIDFQPFKNCKFKNSSFGEIPKEWKIYDFKDFLKIRDEKSNKQNIPKFSITNNGIQHRDEKFKKNLSSPSSKFKLVYKNDLIFGMSREILNWGLMNDEIGGVSSAYNIFIIEKLNPRYLESFIKHRIVYFKDIIKPASREGQGIDKNILFNKQIYVPPNNIIDDYYRIEDKFVNLINNNNKETYNLASLKDNLLPKLMSGEVDVSNVEI